MVKVTLDEYISITRTGTLHAHIESMPTTARTCCESDTHALHAKNGTSVLEQMYIHLPHART